jgi:predicted O-methyltransferase YrrM
MTRPRWSLLLVLTLAAASVAASAIWLRLAVLPFRGIDPSPALRVIRNMETNGGLFAADGRLLYDQIVSRRYQRGLDLGTADGYGALWMAMAFRKTGGSLVSVEIDPDTAARARENFRRARMDDIIDLRNADALQEVPRLSGEFDFVFMDLGAPLNKKLLDLLRDHVRPGGALLAHNAEAFRWTQPDFLEALARDPQLETSFRGVIFQVSVSVKRP